MINQIPPEVSHHFIKNKYVYLLIVICLIQIFLAGQADLSNYDPNHDVISYRKMAIAFPSIDESVGKPFAYRLLAPWLVGFVFNDVDLGFILLNALFSILFVITLFYFFTLNKTSERIAFYVTAAFILNRYFIPNFAYEPYRFADVLSNLLLLLTLIFLAEKKYALVFILSFIGILARESALLIIPVGMVYIFLSDQKNKLLFFISFSILLFAIFILIRIFVPIEQGISLTQAFIENWTKLFSPEALAKQFFLAFNPFFLIPIISYKEFLSFNKKNLHWIVLLIFVLFSSLFGGDKERLMFTYAPIYYLFISVLFQKLEDALKIKTTTLIMVFLLCWITNLHHIWGIIRLPSREMSLVFAVFGGIIMLMIYLKARAERKEIL